MDAAAGALDDDSPARVPHGWAHGVLAVLRWVSFVAAAGCLFQMLVEISSLVSGLKYGQSQGIDLVLSVTKVDPAWHGTTEYDVQSVAQPGSVWFSQAHARVVGVPVHAIVLIHAGALLALVTVFGILFCVELLARRLLDGAGFTVRAVRVIVVLAFVIMVGFTASSLITQIGHIQVGPVGYHAASDDSDWLLSTTPGLSFDFTPLYPGLALLGLAAAFGIGARLQRETEGLV